MATIDSTQETVIPFSQAADELPRLRRGRKINVSTLYRWSNEGCRGEVLETVQLGATRCTSREALQRFFQRLSEAKQSMSQPNPQPQFIRRTLAQRQKASQRAERQ